MDEMLVQEARAARDRFIEAQHDADNTRAEYHHTIRRLHASGGSMREIAHALGLSHQRVHQIIDDAGAARAEPAKKGLLKRLTGGVEQETYPPPEGRPAIQAFDRDVREAVVLAQEQARSLSHQYIGTEHILIGLLSVEHGIAARVLARAGANQQQVRAEVVQIIGRGRGKPPDGPLHFTPQSKKVVQLAIKEAKHDRSPHVRGEHLLLGLLREGKGVGAQVLTRLGADHDSLRTRLGQARCVCSFCRRPGIELASLVAGPGVYICERCTREATLLAADPDAKTAHTPLAVVPAGQEDTACTFCGESTGSNRLVAGPDAVICSQCLVICREITAEDEPPDN